MVTTQFFVTQGRYSFATKAHTGSGLGTRFDRTCHFSVDGFYRYFATEYGFRVRNLHFGIQVVVMTFKFLMRLYVYFYKKVATCSAVGARLALSTDTYTLSMVDSGRDRYLDLLFACNVTGSVAVGTFVLDHFSGTMTMRTCGYILHHTK